MTWKLCVAVLCVHFACCLQAPMDGKDMMMRMLMQRMMGEQGGDDRGEEGEMGDHEDMKKLIQMYMGEHGIDEDEETDDVGPVMLYHYTQMMEGELKEVEAAQAGDLVAKSLLKDLIEDPEAPGDFAKQLVLQSVKSWAPPADDKMKLMAHLFEYLMRYPDGEQSEMAKMMLKHLVAQQGHFHKAVLRGMTLHYMYQSRGRQLELLTELMGFLMSDDLAEEMGSTELLQLLIQQYSYTYDTNEDQSTMALFLLGSYADRKDAQGKQFLRYMIKKAMLGGRKDIPEEYQWKYLPPGPCRIEDIQSGTVISQMECPYDLTCDLTPLQYSFDGRPYRYTMCRYPQQFFPYHACEVTYPSGEVDTRNNCDTATCNFGPFTLPTDDGDMRATFCSDYANVTTNISSFDPMLLRSCSVEDSTGFRYGQRRCPYGQKCGGSRYPVYFNNITFHGYLCQNDGAQNMGEDKENFMEQLLETMLGFHGGMEEEDEMGEGAMDGDFIQHLITKMMSEYQMQGEEDKMEDKDIKPFKVMAYLVQKMAPDSQVLNEFVEAFKAKHYKGLINNADRVFMHGIIRHLLAVWAEEQRGGGRQEGDLDDLMGWMMHMKKKMMMEKKEEMKERHEEHHEELEEKVGHIIKHLQEKEEEEQEGEKDIMKMLLYKLMGGKKDD